MAGLEGWVEANQAYLAQALARLRARLLGEGEAAAKRALARHARSMPALPAVERLSQTFGLSPFERDLLVLCAGVELDAEFGPLCARVQGDPQKLYATFGLALAALAGAHWTALLPSAPLRRWRLLELVGGAPLTQAQLRIDERVLHDLVGVDELDERLAGLVRPLAHAARPAPSQAALAERIAATWASAPQPLPVVHLNGATRAAQLAVAGALGSLLGRPVHVLAAAAITKDVQEVDLLARLWQREAALSGRMLLIDCHAVDSGEAGLVGLARLLEDGEHPLLVASPERVRVGSRPALGFEVQSPPPAEQWQLWTEALGGVAADVDGALERIVGQFNLASSEITAAAAIAANAGGDLENALWEACRAQARPRLEDLAERIEPAATWDDLVLPDAEMQVLREIAVQLRHRYTVYEKWGFRSRSRRGLGMSALFTGPSGTGKTMAAEVLADSLRLDLYRIDLSQVVSKYIGETEKNLRRVFDAAEGGGAVLLFDEADALFGKRSEVRDSHDRYANIEVGYLLQRMESYRGLAVLTTNMRDALDPAFLRRLRFAIEFPFPEAEQRHRIWSRIYPAATPVADLKIDRLAQLSVTGGTIRNIALNAAFQAADASRPVSMSHLLLAAKREYTKIERRLTEVEVRGWE